ncbi:hypothetical protein [Solicola sp. PLA-1-18]|uniref:hypothetical protein n=1 Tax=Solicola sp. PLA-1-18 TaxID=3380532 RepID=UPI003B7B376B
MLDDLLAPLGRLLWVPLRFVGGLIVQIFWELVVHGLWESLVVRRADGPDRVGWELVRRALALVAVTTVAAAAAIALWRVATG